jgi:outer membrane murein-binding lipoprotein Lpp
MARISGPGLMLQDVSQRIVVLRGQKVLLDADLARLYGVSTARLNEQIKRNVTRFPPDFIFRLRNQELNALISQIATSKNGRPGRGGTRKLPLAFTEHGAIMAASVLNTPRAIETSVFIVRAFIRMRDTLAGHKELASKLDELEKRTQALSSKHDALASDTRAQLRQIVHALRQLMTPRPPKRRPIGFVTPADGS